MGMLRHAVLLALLLGGASTEQRMPLRSLVSSSSTPSVPAGPPTGRTPPTLNRQPRSYTGPYALWNLTQHCFHGELGDYDYTLCPFANVTQRQKGTSWTGFWGVLGIFDSWTTSDVYIDGTPAKVYVSQVFNDGTDCGGKARKTTVNYTCSGPWGTTAVRHVAEPKTCEYTMTLACPEACGVDWRVGHEGIRPPTPSAVPSPSPTPAAQGSSGAVAASAGASASAAAPASTAAVSPSSAASASPSAATASTTAASASSSAPVASSASSTGGATSTGGGQGTEQAKATAAATAAGGGAGLVGAASSVAATDISPHELAATLARVQTLLLDLNRTVARLAADEVADNSLLSQLNATVALLAARQGLGDTGAGNSSNDTLHSSAGQAVASAKPQPAAGAVELAAGSAATADGSSAGGSSSNGSAETLPAVVEGPPSPVVAAAVDIDVGQQPAIDAGVAASVHAEPVEAQAVAAGVIDVVAEEPVAAVPIPAVDGAAVTTAVADLAHGLVRDEPAVVVAQPEVGTQTASAAHPVTVDSV